MHAHHLPRLPPCSEGWACCYLVELAPVHWYWQPSLFTHHHRSPQTQTTSSGCRSCHRSIAWWRVEPLQGNYTFISPAQPARLPSPLTLPVSSLLCSTRPTTTTFMFLQRLHSTTTSISTWCGSDSSVTPLTSAHLISRAPLFSHILPPASEQRLGRWRPRRWRWG